MAGLVGLAITYSLSVTNLLGGVVMFFTETEKQLVSVERANHYITAIPYEKWDGSLFVSFHPQVFTATRMPHIIDWVLKANYLSIL